MKFEWDEKKNAVNFKKHEVDFNYAIGAFFDPMSREFYDYKHSGMEEDRMMLVGDADGDILLIIFTEPDAETIRIISARKATKQEMEALYYGNS